MEIEGLLSTMVAVGFFAVAALLLLVTVGIVIVRRLRGEKASSAGVLAFLVSIVVFVLGGAGALTGVAWIAKETDDAIVFWGPAVVLLALIGGFVSWLLAGRVEPPEA